MTNPETPAGQGDITLSEAARDLVEAYDRGPHFVERRDLWDRLRILSADQGKRGGVKAEAEVTRIMALSDEEILREANVSDVAWARGFKQGLKMGRSVAALTAEPRAREEEGPCISTGTSLGIPGDWRDNFKPYGDVGPHNEGGMCADHSDRRKPSTPKPTPDRHKLREAVAEIPLGHIRSYAGSGMVDLYRCSCGWESQPYFDGAEYAEQEWKRHLALLGAEPTAKQRGEGEA